jgi:NTE family protein
MELKPASPGRVLFISALASFVAFLDVTIVNVAFPSIRASFGGVSLPAMSWVLNGYNVAFAALLVPAGRYADYFGHRRAFALGLVGFTFASAVAGAAPSAGVLVAARVAQAAAAAVLVPTSAALLLAAFPPGRRATAIGLWSAAAGVAAATGPSLGGAIIAASGWRLVFLVNIPVGLAALWLSRELPAGRRRARMGLPDAAGIVLVGSAMGLLALGIVEGGDWGWTGARVLGSLTAALVMSILFVLRSRRHPSPVIDLALFSNVEFSVANLGTLVFAAAFYAMLLNNVLFMTQVWGYSALEAGLGLTPAPIVAAVVAGFAGRFADRHGYRPVILPGTSIYALGAVYLAARTGSTPAYWSEFFPGAVLIGIGVGLALPTLGSAAVAALGEAEFAAGSAVNSAARQVGAVLGVAGVISVLAHGSRANPLGPFDTNWGLIAAVAALAGPGVWMLIRPAGTRPPLTPRPRALRRPRGSPRP